MGALSKLEAVNHILMAAGEYPVSTLAITGSNDVTMAIFSLNREAMALQLAGTNANTRFTTVMPSNTGRILIPDETISIDTVGIDENRNIIARGRNPTYLFDVDNNTDIFEQNVEIRVRIVIALDFEELSTPEQFQAMDAACRYYQMATVGEVAQDRVLTERMVLSRAAGRAENIRSLDANFMNSRKSPWPTIAGRRTIGPY